VAIFLSRKARKFKLEKGFVDDGDFSFEKSTQAKVQIQTDDKSN
jgi:hypothetical protein